MGPIGWQEMVFIFLLALVLFGPKKLPELGRTLGKAITEFRRAQGELKATFDREMRNLERETDLKEITGGYQYDNYHYNYDYSSGEAGSDPYGSYGEPYDSAATPHDSTATITATTSASATQGAESSPVTPPEGAVAHGTEPKSLPGPSQEVHPSEAGAAPAAEAANGTVATGSKA